jgi:TonB-linked SusC/RagA family outer membrane protein
MKTKLSGILTLLLAFVVQVTFAQERTITGTVSDETGVLPGVSVLIEGTTSGTETDFDGNFSIEAKSGDVLRFSFVGKTTVTRSIGAESTINVTMVSEQNTLDEVVVTALGISREKKSLGYATQEVDGDQISTVKDPNFTNALQGKVAGLNVKSSGTMGGSTNVIIRGFSSLTGNNQALFVVDGVPISNQTANDSGVDNGYGGYDYGNNAADVNPDDIESVNILKGGAATALYGSQAANGVVVITTKKGKVRPDRGIGVTINSTVTFNKVNNETLPEYQAEYGAGYGQYYGETGYFEDIDFNGDGITELATPSYEDASFGGAFDPSLLVVQWPAWYPQLGNYGVATPWVAGANNPTSFFNTGVSMFNTVTLDGGNEKGTFKLGYTNLNQTGIMPNSEIKRHNVDFGATYKLTEKFTASADVHYTQTNGKGRFGTGYDGRNVMQSFRQWFQINVDLDQQRDAYFQTKENITWNPRYPDDLKPIFFDNPYWERYENYQNDTRHRVYGNMALTYQINDYLSVLGRVSIDTYNTLQEERVAIGSLDVPNYSRYNNSYLNNNYDLMLNFDKQITDKFNIRAVAGVNIFTVDYNSINASTNGGLNVPRLYALSNTKDAMVAPAESEYYRRTDGYYINASLGWDNTLFLDASYRYDISSTLPTGNNGYGYYGVSGSFLFSSLFNSNFISLGKLRAGYAVTGNSAPPLSVYNTYDLLTPMGGQGNSSLPATNQNPNLKNETSYETEIGLEMSMFKNRLGFDLSVYDKTSEDLITPVSITTATGFGAQWLNAGTVQNRGVELSLWGSPVRTSNFEWRIDVNWAKNESEVISLPQGLDNLLLANTQAVSINATVGEPYGTIQGSDFVYTNGERTINEFGRYVRTSSQTNVLGNFQPDWKGGINNRFTYKNLSLSFLIDVQQGGSVFSLDTWYGYGTGVYQVTAGLNELGNPKRDPVTDGPDSGGILLQGVQADGTPNTIRTRMDYYANALGWTRAPHALHVYDADYVKLRELSISYSLNPKIFRGYIQGMTFTALGRNLWIIDKSMPHSDPEAGLTAGNVQGHQSGAYPTTKDIGFSVKIEF